MPHPITSFSNALTLKFISDSTVSFGGFHATYAASTSACGGIFHMAEGIFNSPGYPEVYPANVECVWNVVSSPGNQLQLSFIAFQLEESQDCSRDFVEVREGNATGRLVGRYCGNALPLNYSSTVGHILWIRFVSDGSGSGVGFQAAFASIFGNDNIVGTHGKIASPLWPGNYPLNSNYQWIVNVEESQVIHARILEMDMEGTLNCYYDKLKIYDGAGIHSRLVGTYCGTQTDSFSSTGSSLTFQFSSDSSISGRGFLLEWFAMNASVGPLPTIATGACGGFLQTGEAPVFLYSPGWPESYSNGANCMWLIQAPDSTVELNILSLDIESHSTCSYDKLVIRDGCGGYLHADRGIITSPRYPETYTPDLNCSWHVQVQSGLTIAVHLEQPFQIPNRDSSCNQGDYLVLKNGPDLSSPPLGPHGGNGRFCGSHPSSTLFTSDNQMFVQFISDNSNEGQGFKITYEAKSLACGGNIYIHNADSTGYVTSPNHPDHYPQHADCIWLIAAPPGKLIRLQFEGQFSIEVTPNCTSSYLELRDGADSNAPILSKFCGTSLPISQLSSGEVMYLRFRSDNSPTHVGFKAKYSVAPCGGTVTGQSGVIESNGYPTQPYTDDLFCEWRLRGPMGHYLTIHFEDFNLQNSSGCERDFVEIWENHTSGTLLGRYCGSSIPKSVDTSSNVALVRFVTDDSLSASGFRLRFDSSLEACGGDLQAPSGTFTSPNYRNPNPHGWMCEWRITVQEGRQVTLTFNSLRLEAHPFCSSEHVTVFNGIRSNSPQLEKLCSSVNGSNEIESSGNTMKVIYFTDGSRPYGGFTASYTSSEDAVCGGSLTSFPEGNFTSPGYDGVSNYSRNLNCEWTLSNPNQGNSSIYIHFEDFYLESHQDCQSDVLEFRVGNADGLLIWRLCGSSKPRMPLVIPYPQIGDSGVISSPNYPAAYDSLTHCSWLLEAPQGHTINLTFRDFDIEAHENCAWDSITVRNGGSPGSPIIGHYCGTLNPGTIQSGSNQLVVWADTQESSQTLLATSCGNVAPGPITTPRNVFTAVFQSQEAPAQGFSASFVSRCGRNFTSPSGYIVSPNYPKQYDNNMNCTYIIEASPLSVILLTLVSFHLEAHSAVTGSCVNDGVHIIRGYNLSSTPLATLCGEDNLSPLTVSGPVLLNFYSNAHTTDLGFKFSYRITCE
ncbi:CUBN [Cervus elaphus hippelaphus]|uniref:CUBN n=1 Tax=Cervus elaphus hippelaphus TaxID=46360 RepID=A0A212CAS2_CEREH|nr:CUBN [Cervus elaphus hippelaphus]